MARTLQGGGKGNIWAAINTGGIGYAEVADMLNDPTHLPKGVGQVWEAGGFRYEEAESNATDHHVTTAGGVKLYVLPGADGAVNVLAFGAKGDGVTDDTSYFDTAQLYFKHIKVPVGDFVVDDLRIRNNVNLIGSGYQNTRFLQGAAGNPAINCTSDVTVGQLLSLRLENFGVVGHASATVAAVKFEALSPYAIYRSNFDFIVGSTYQAIHMEASNANNVFYCSFKVDVVGTDTTAVVLNGGCYNTYDFFIVSCGNGRAIEHNGFNNTFVRLVTDAQIYCDGQNIVFIGPTVEEMPTEPAVRTAIILEGFNQTLITPTVILGAASSARIDYCMKTFSDSLVINPRFIVDGVPDPFEPLAGGTSFTLQGPGQNQCDNKMEVQFTGATSDRDLARVTKIGDVSDFIAGSDGPVGKTTQYATPASGASINYSILNATDAMIFEPAGTVTLINVTIGYSGVTFRDGKVLTVYTSEAISSLTWAAGTSDVSLFPASMASGDAIRLVYNAAQNKWYPF